MRIVRFAWLAFWILAGCLVIAGALQNRQDWRSAVIMVMACELVFIALAGYLAMGEGK